MEVKRDVAIDICKGIGIMLMVLGHSGLPKAALDFIYMFHMPLFFFVSGYCFDERYLNMPVAFIKKKVKGLWVPYVKYSLLFLLLHNLFCYLNIYSTEYGYQGQGVDILSIGEIKNRVWSIVTDMSGTEQLLGGFWFLKQLLLGSVISLIAMKIIRKLRIRYHFFGFLNDVWSIVFLLLASVMMNKYVLVYPCFNIQSLTVLAAAIFLVGYVYKGHKCCVNLLWSAIFAMFVCLGSVLMPREMLNLQWFEIIPYFFIGVMGTVMTLNISRYISIFAVRIGQFFSWAGRVTLIILTWHFLAFKIVSIFIISKEHLQIEHLGEFPVIYEFAVQGWWLVYFVVAMLITLSIARAKETLLFRHKNIAYL